MLHCSYPPAEAVIGKQAPAFSAPAVVDGEIANVSLDQYRGKWVVLLFYPVSNATAAAVLVFGELTEV